MTYHELLQLMYECGFTRVEKDDRLLDVLTEETRERGVELWECWPAPDGRDQDVQILRVRQPYEVAELQLFTLPRARLEALLLANEQLLLADEHPVADGADVRWELLR